MSIVEKFVSAVTDKIFTSKAENTAAALMFHTGI